MSSAEQVGLQPEVISAVAMVVKSLAMTMERERNSIGHLY